jgi:hypothetical protein
MVHSVKNIERFTIRTLDGKIGKAHTFFFDDRHWTIRYLVVDTGNWLLGRQVLISPVAVGKPLLGEEVLPVNLTREQVEKSPGLDLDQPISRQFEAELTDYYGWPIYWGAGIFGPGTAGMPGTVVTPDAPTLTAHYASAATLEKESEKAAKQAASSEPTLRSTRDVLHYRIEATDGVVGHVDDFLIDDEDWSIKGIVVMTRNWLPGPRVVIKPEWIDRVSWHEGRVFVNVTTEAVRNAPQYEPELVGSA